MSPAPNQNPTGASLRSRIFLWFLGLLLLLQITTAWVVYTFSLENVENQIRDRLISGQALFVNEFTVRSRYLKNSVDTIAKDWALRQALGQNDSATLTSALNNHRRRIEADLGFVSDNNGELLGSTLDGNSTLPPQLITDLKQRLTERQLQTDEHIVQIDNRLYQLVIAPIRAPLPIGWVAMGFAMDDELAQHFRTITSLDISFIGLGEVQDQVFASTVGEQNREQLSLTASNAESLTTAPHYNANNADIFQLGTPLQTGSGSAVMVLMQESVQTLLEQFERWWINLLALFAAALTAAAIIAAVIARSVTRPVSSLLEIAREVTSGNFATADNNDKLHYRDAQRNDEIGALAREFETMQQAVAEREREIRHRAEHDPLTGLYNRAKLLSSLQTLIDQSCGDLAVLLLNINRFKEINDTLGHHYGDQLLLQVSRRLAKVFPENQLAHLGADQFVVFLPLTGYQQIPELCQQITNCFAEPFNHNDIDIVMAATQGVATYPKHAQDALSLLRLADVAIHTAKARHQEVAIYDARLDHHSVQRLSLMSDLPNAIEQNQLELYYQPTLKLAGPNDYRLAKVECLVRWNHPVYGFVPPDDFINLAEQSGAITQLTRWVLKTALQQCHQWQQQGLEIGVAVNISAVDLFRGELPTLVPQLLQQYQVPKQLLTLEVTESEVMEDPEHARRVLQQLRDLGVRLSVDDYGTGHSSLAHLKQLPVQELKIDKSFVLNLTRDQDDKAIVRSTIELGHTMGLVVVAEGVEDQASLEYLQSLGSDYAQGFFISRPLSQSDLAQWLSNTDYALTQSTLQPQV